MWRVAAFIMAALLLTASANWFSAASQSLSALFPIKQHGKWGFIDRTGKVVITPQFNTAWEFSEGRAGARGLLTPR